jgi:hypothetical protein
MTACLFDPVCLPDGWPHAVGLMVGCALVLVAVLIIAFPVRQSFQDDWRRRRR